MDTPTKCQSGPTAKDGPSAQLHSKSSLTRKPSNCRVIKSRFREAAARAGVDGNSSGNCSTGPNSLITLSGTSTNKKTNSANPQGSVSKTKKITAAFNDRTTSTAARSLVRNKVFASSTGATLNNSNSSSNNSNQASSSNNSSGASSSLSRTNSFGKANVKMRLNGITGLRNAWNSGLNAKKKIEPPPPPPPSTKVSNKLHSTAMNATLLNTTSNTSQFSSTVLSQRGRVFSNSFPDLPDISAIKLDPFGKGDSSGNNSGGPVPSPCDIISEEQEESREVSDEDVELSYLNYLTWCNLTASASHAHTAALSPVMKELSFLEDAVSTKQTEAFELRQKVHLLQTLGLVQQEYATLQPLLTTLNEGSGAWRDGIESLARQLEHHLHQLTLAPAVLPDTAEEIAEPLRDITSQVQCLLQLIQPCDDLLHTATSVLHGTTTLARVTEDLEETASLALQKCSLAIC